jgi:uncharacterized protein (TIGR02099 family)
MIAGLPQKLGDTIRVSMDIEGNLFEPASTQGTLYVDGKKLQLHELIVLSDQALPQAISIKSGIADLKIWANWQQDQLVKLSGEINVKQLNLSRPDRGVFPANQLDAGFSLGLDNNRWQLNVQHFNLQNSDSLISSIDKTSIDNTTRFSLSAELAQNDELNNLGVFIERLELKHAAEVVAFFAPLSEPQIVQLKQAQLQGVLNKVFLFADWQAKTFAVNGAFSHLKVDGFAKNAPGVVDINGRIKGTEQQGVVRLFAQDAWITLASLFREPLPIAKLDGEVSWRQTAEEWLLSSDSLVLNSLSIQSDNYFRVKLPKSNAPIFIDLQNSFAAGDVSQVRHYLPAETLKKEDVDWLDRAFVSGQVPKGGMLFYGNLNDFPFNKGEGVFEVVFTVDAMELNYDPAWPHVTNLGAEVLFEKNSLQVNVKQGLSELLTIKQAEVTIPSMDTSSHFFVKGEFEGEIAQVLGFMQHTPLNSSVDALVDTITPQGITQVTLDLALPRVIQAQPRVKVSAKLNNAELNVKALDLRVSKITGDLKFNEQGIYSDTIHAATMAQPIQINVKSTTSQTTVKVAGRVGVSELETQFNIPLSQVAEGMADYRLTLALPYDNSAAEILVESLLQGVELQLPGNLAKSRQQQKELALNVRLEDKALLPVMLTFDNQLKAALLLDSKQHSLYSGHVLVGEGNAAQSDEPGVTLEINRDRLPLQEWLSGLSVLQQNQNRDQQNNAASGAQIKEIKIHSDHAIWKTAELGVFDLTLRHQDQGWFGSIDSAVAKGKMLIPNDLNKGTVKFEMASLDLNAIKQFKSVSDNQGIGLLPESMPLLTLTSQKTMWQTTDFGQLIVETERIAGGIGFKHIELSGNGQKLMLTGDWKSRGEQRSATHLQGRLDMPQASRTIAQLGITKDFAETSGTVEFKLDWPAAPYQFALADLRGQVDVNMKNGRILSIEPGFGRVLGVLAVAQWLKRLQLDFSDVYGEGMTFNSIKGHFDLVNGKAVTQDLLVDAVPAVIAITGETDLVNRTGEHIVNVTPKSADAVPIAGTIMGKVAALVGQSLTGKNQEGFFFGSQYLVKGAWANAQIIPLHENDGLLQKTWNGLTDFSWIQQKNNQQER